METINESSKNIAKAKGLIDKFCDNYVNIPIELKEATELLDKSLDILTKTPQ